MLVGALGFLRRIEIGLGGVALFGVIGIFMAITRRIGGSIDDGIPTLIGVSAGATALWFAHLKLTPLITTTTAADSGAPTQSNQSSAMSARSTRRTRRPPAAAISLFAAAASWACSLWSAVAQVPLAESSEPGSAQQRHATL
jgi:hypothetical protein